MWPSSLLEARLVQQRLRAKVITEDRLGLVRIVAGVDAWTEPARERIWAAAVALSLSDLEIQESAVVCQPIAVPYVPGFLSLREAPAALAALERLRARPGLVFVDGQGLAHPRRFGLACHIGLLAAIPRSASRSRDYLGGTSRREPIAENGRHLSTTTKRWARSCAPARARDRYSFRLVTASACAPPSIMCCAVRRLSACPSRFA
jgi:deoxyinosine 3'endonuclease (endonuclease V)